MFLTTIILFLLILGVIVFFHELGHFLMAKLYGVKVDEFGLGFPPKAWGIKKGETEYTLNWVPLGGFVKIVGEDGESKNDPRSFSSRSIGQRFQILAAGVAMNFFLAFLIFSAVFMLGFPQDITGEKLSPVQIDKQNSQNSAVAYVKNVGRARDIKVQISYIVEKSPADKAELKVGDAIAKIGGKEVRSVEDAQSYINENLEKPTVLNITRGKESFTKEIIPRKDHPENEGPMGVTLIQTAIVSYSPLEAIKRGYKYTVELTVFIILAFAGVLWSLIATGKSAVEISGPVGIAAMTQQAAALGFMTVLNFTALISVNLAIINALPFPALDGGRLLFLIVEKIKGSPLNQEWEAKANNFGFMLLMFLMAVVTFKDLMKFDIIGKVIGLFG